MGDVFVTNGLGNKNKNSATMSFYAEMDDTGDSQKSLEQQRDVQEMEEKNELLKEKINNLNTSKNIVPMQYSQILQKTKDNPFATSSIKEKMNTTQEVKSIYKPKFIRGTAKQDENSENTSTGVKRRAWVTIDVKIRYGIRGTVLTHFESYLTNRKQIVKISSENGLEFSSNIVDLKKGVPQGSILGPLLFILYVNDLPQCHDNIFMYADDTTAIFKSSTIGYLISNIVLTQKNIFQWFQDNGLELNVGKTQYIKFGDYGFTNSKININNICRIELSRYLN
ncbi:unnamed protein product [Brassicogethes aeneus]|uniref:Reverse transcriptase domain-containing protein n=1 Tax=Brassicogethes aeneus TaxID=1431903 RepID=A0A9P0AZ68_BRAAE|nr:unnamed protein product [Brassicogethes aeneus]